MSPPFGLLALLLSSSVPGLARADWRQDVRLAVSNKGLSLSRFPPLGFKCGSKKAKKEDSCKCWGTDGRSFPYQVQGDLCRIPGGCLADSCKASGADWKYAEAGSLDAMAQQLGQWSIGGNIVTSMKKSGKKKSSSFKVVTSESGCSGSPGKNADCNVWIGAVRNDAGVVQFGVAKATSKCNLRKVFKTKKCEGTSIHSRGYEDKTEKRKFTSTEKKTIQRNMQAQAYFAAANKAYPHSMSAEESRRLYNETFANSSLDKYDAEDEDARLKTLAEGEAEFMREWGHIFTMVSLDEYLEEAANRTTSAHGRKLLQANPFGMLESAIGSITGAWSGITSAFGSKYEEQLLDTRMDNGWKKFKQKTKVFKGTGLTYKNLPQFMKKIPKMIGLQSKYKKDFLQITEWMQFFDDQTWSQHDTQFSMGKGGKDSSFTMFSRNRQSDEKMDVLFLTCSQTFKLADNYMVISESSSKLGGLFSSTKIKIKKMKAGLKTEDLKFISSYFSLLAYQQIAIAQGLQVPPDPQFP